MIYKFCAPEFISSFDEYRGGTRNHDLLIIAERNDKENVVISVESKADETFDRLVSEAIRDAKRAKLENQNSRKVERVEGLRLALFGEIEPQQLTLRYQLLTAVAGTIAEAVEHEAKKAVFLVQTFVSGETDKDKQKENAQDLDAFIVQFSKGAFTVVPENQLIGPFRVAKPTKHLPAEVDLWIGKYSIEI